MWGCFAASGSAALYKVNGAMNKENYVKFRQETLKSSARRLTLGWSGMFKQNNDPKHINDSKGMAESG